MLDFEWVSVRSAEAASRVLSEQPGAFAKAGGIDLLDLMKEGIVGPSALVDISRLEGGADIAVEDEGIRLGAGLTLNDLATHPVIRQRLPLLAAVVGSAATPQIRNVATLGGNLAQRPRCWYFRSIDHDCLKKGGDTCPALEGDHRFHAIFEPGPCAAVAPSSALLALVALDGRIELVRSDSTRQIPAGEFAGSSDPMRENCLDPDELIGSVFVPWPAVGTLVAHQKIREKETFDWPVAEVALCLLRREDRTIASARLVLGAAAGVPWRAERAEAVLQGSIRSEALAREAAAAAVDDAAPLPGNRYKVALFAEIVRRAILAAA